MTTASKVGRFLLNLLIALLIVAGAISVGRWLFVAIWAAVSGIHLQWNGDFFKADLAVWVTAVATLALWWATVQLSRATRRQIKADGPVLRVDLLMDVPAGSVPLPYDDSFREQDNVAAGLAQHLATPRYIYLGIHNQQPKPTGLAGEVEINVALYYGAQQPAHPHWVRRTFKVPVLGPNYFVVGAVANIGQLPAYIVAVEQVKYRDIFGGRRSAAWGTNLLVRNNSGAVLQGYKIFEAGKGEFG